MIRFLTSTEINRLMKGRSMNSVSNFRHSTGACSPVAMVMLGLAWSMTTIAVANEIRAASFFPLCMPNRCTDCSIKQD